MRVLTVGNRYPPHGTGGYERIWQALVAGLAAAGHDVAVLTTRPDARGGGSSDPGNGALEPTPHRVAEPEAARDALRAGQPEIARELAWYWHDHAFLPLGLADSRELERHNAEVLEAHGRGADLVVWLSMGGMSLGLTARTPAPQLAVVHDGWPIYGPGVDPWTARWGRLAKHRYDPARIDWWSCNSGYTRDTLVRADVGVDPARASVESPGIDPAAFPASPAPPWRGELLVLGRVEPRKGVADAIAALPDDMRLTVTGPAAAAYAKELRGLADGRAVRFRGPTDAAATTLAAADAVLFPVTWAEPWGLVPLEAMAVGRPVVATGTGGSAEYLRDGDNALLVPPGDPPALRAAVQRLAGDPALRERLVAGGRATAARYTEAGWVAQVVARAERVAASPSDRPARD